MILDEKLRPELNPHRVYGILRFISENEGAYTRLEIKNLMNPDVFGSDAFAPCYSWAQSQGLIKEDVDNKIRLKGDKEHLTSLSSFRAYLANKLFESYDESNRFYSFTSFYMQINEDALVYDSFEEFINKQRGEFIDLNKEFILGWRLWASFLGLGFILKSNFIPYPFIRMKDILCTEALDFQKGKKYIISEFTSKLLSHCPELKKACENNSFNFSVSLALRELHNSKILRLERIQDAQEIWKIYNINGHEITDSVTHVTLVGDFDGQ